MNLATLIEFSESAIRSNRKDLFLKVQSITSELINSRCENDYLKSKSNIERFKTFKIQSDMNVLESNYDGLNQSMDGLKSKISSLEIENNDLERVNNALEEQNNNLRKNVEL